MSILYCYPLQCIPCTVSNECFHWFCILTLSFIIQRFVKGLSADFSWTSPLILLSSIVTYTSVIISWLVVDYMLVLFVRSLCIRHLPRWFVHLCMNIEVKDSVPSQHRKTLFSVASVALKYVCRSLPVSLFIFLTCLIGLWICLLDYESTENSLMMMLM